MFLCNGKLTRNTASSVEKHLWVAAIITDKLGKTNKAVNQLIYLAASHSICIKFHPSWSWYLLEPLFSCGDVEQRLLFWCNCVCSDAKMAERWRRLCRQYNMREKDFCLKLTVILASLVPINLQAPSLRLQLRPKECSWWEAQLLPSSWSSVFSTSPVLKNDAVNTFPGQKSAVPISLSLWGLLEGREELSRPKDSLAKDFSQDFCANENYEVCITMTEINWGKKCSHSLEKTNSR